MRDTFIDADEAFRYFYQFITDQGVDYRNTRALFNIGFKILRPKNREIITNGRNWNKEYAEFEWQWYLKGDPNGDLISKRAAIWKNHMDKNGNIRSNYGWQWNRNNQLDRVVDILKKDINSRQAVISLYDGKEIETYEFDTPCTLNVSFYVLSNKLCMTVNMRSNDLWFGFCNDQYCFSKLQEYVAKSLDLQIGFYYHFASNLHIYNDKLGML